MGRSALLGHVVNTSPPRREFVPVYQNFKITKIKIIQNYSSSAYYLQIKIKKKTIQEKQKGEMQENEFNCKSPQKM